MSEITGMTVASIRSAKDMFEEISATLPPRPLQIVDVESAYAAAMIASVASSKMLLRIIEQQQAQIDKQNEEMTSLMDIMQQHIDSSEKLANTVGKMMDQQEKTTEHVSQLTHQTNTLTDISNDLVAKLEGGIK